MRISSNTQHEAQTMIRTAISRKWPTFIIQKFRRHIVIYTDNTDILRIWDEMREHQIPHDQLMNMTLKTTYRAIKGQFNCLTRSEEDSTCMYIPRIRVKILWYVSIYMVDDRYFITLLISDVIYSQAMWCHGQLRRYYRTKQAKRFVRCDGFKGDQIRKNVFVVVWLERIFSGSPAPAQDVLYDWMTVLVCHHDVRPKTSQHENFTHGPSN